MNSPSFASGTEIALPVRISSPVIAPGQSNEPTLKDLLHHVSVTSDSRHRMLRSTANRVSEFLNKPVDTIAVEELNAVRTKFYAYIKGRKYADITTRTYCHLLERLVGCAQEAGWLPEQDALLAAWQPIQQAIGATADTRIIPFAIRTGRSPRDFSDADLDAWGDSLVQNGRHYRSARVAKARFRKALVNAGVQHRLPKLRVSIIKTAYKVQTSDMPEPLRSEVQELLAWKQAKFAKGRPQWTRHRPLTAKLLENHIGRIYGYATNIAHFGDVKSLQDLFTERVVGAYFEWGLNERNLTKSTLLHLSMLYGAMRHHPKYKDRDYTWFTTLFDEVPEDDPSRLEEKKARKYVPYHVLLQIPARIRAARLKLESSSSEYARLLHDELLLTWMTTLPWRQRNLRECRAGQVESAHIFFAELPQLVHVAKAKWAEEALQKDPHQRFWQFHFRPDETKTGKAVRGIVPRRLVPLLEQYLNKHRSQLVANTDPGTLFLRPWGGSFNVQRFNEYVAEIVLRYTGKRMTPHLFRDAFAYAYLEAHPEDYLTLSKILWHSSVKYTLSVYGKNFDESNGARRVDEWLSPS